MYDELVKRLRNAAQDDMQEILVSDGKFVWTDTYCVDGDECYLDGGNDLDELWWMPLPEPPKEKK